MRNSKMAVRKVRVSTGGVLGVMCVIALAGEARAQSVVPNQLPAQSQPAAQAQTPTPAAAPAALVPLGLNGEIAPWLQVRGEFRTRIEGFTGGGFAQGNDDAYWMDRFRLNATLRPSKSLGFFVQVHDARAFNKASGASGVPFRDTVDLRAAYGELVMKRASIRIGRQDMVFGEQRLIGSLGWANTARSFDGARLTLRAGGVQLDTFATSVVTIRPDAFDKSGSGNYLYGAYGSLSTLIPKQVFEPYFLWRQSQNIVAELGGADTMRQATTGIRLAGKLPALFDYSGEIAVQTGSVGPDDISAWASHAVVGKSLATTAWRPRVFGELNYASGDKDAADGTRGTFDQLYPTGHDKYGLADQVGWRNVRHVRAGVELVPRKKWQVNGSFHSWWLASATDALYSASGAVVARSLAGTAGTRVGQELDVQAAFTYSPQLQIGGGWAYLMPSAFLKNATQGHAYSYPYVMLTYVFLGEQPAIGKRSPR